MDHRKTIEEQMTLLADWNKAHIEEEPEQVRLNLETMYNIYSSFSSDSSAL